MDFQFSHHISADVDDVARVLLDVDYQNSLAGIGPLSQREVLDQRPIGDGGVRRRVRCVLEIDVSGAARKLLGDSDPAWVEEALWHPENHVWEWRIIPEVGGDLLNSAGTIALHAEDGGTERTVTGKVQVRVPFYGGKVEGWIVDGLRRVYDEEALRLEAAVTADVSDSS